MTEKNTNPQTSKPAFLSGYVDGYETGERDAKRLLKVYKSKSPRRIVRIWEALEHELKTKYKSKNPFWQKGYERGTFEILDQEEKKTHPGQNKARL